MMTFDTTVGGRWFRSIPQLGRLVAVLFLSLASSVTIHAQNASPVSASPSSGGGTFQTILDLLKKAGGWHHGLYLKIDNPPHLELVIEAMDESGPLGLPALSVAHYGEQNGDLMRNPRTCSLCGAFVTLSQVRPIDREYSLCPNCGGIYFVEGR